MNALAGLLTTIINIYTSQRYREVLIVIDKVRLAIGLIAVLETN